MKKNEFDMFKDPDDEIINEIAANYPVLTDEEKERMFSMSERKYNINNNMNNNENGDEVSGVDRYTRPVWRRYAAIAATFVLLAGGHALDLDFAFSFQIDDVRCYDGCFADISVRVGRLLLLVNQLPRQRPRRDQRHKRNDHESGDLDRQAVHVKNGKQHGDDSAEREPDRRKLNGNAFEDQKEDGETQPNKNHG